MSYTLKLSLISFALAVGMIALSLLWLVFHGWFCVLFGTRAERKRAKEGKRRQRACTAVRLPCCQLWPLILATPSKYSFDYLSLAGRSWIDRVYYQPTTVRPWEMENQIEISMSIREKRKLTKKFLAYGKTTQVVSDLKATQAESMDVFRTLQSMQYDIGGFVDGIHENNHAEVAAQQEIADRMLRDAKRRLKEPTQLSV